MIAAAILRTPCRSGSVRVQAVVLGFFTIASFALADAGTAPQVTLVEEGKPNASIVISQDASDMLKEATKDLQLYIKKISGAALPILGPNEIPAGHANLILVGRMPQIHALIPDMDTLDLEHDGVVIRTFPRTLVLTGRSDKGLNTAAWPLDNGASNAIYTFLDILGCRWYAPGEEGEIIPTRRTIAIDALDFVHKPSFRVRDVSLASVSIRGGKMLEDYLVWQRRNRMTANAYYHAHTLRYFINPDTYFSDHPEWFPLIKGKRVSGPSQLCLSNPEMVETITSKYLALLDAQKPWRSYPIGQNDTGPGQWCECKSCLLSYGTKSFTYNEQESLVVGGEEPNIARPNIANGYLAFVNKVADRVAVAHPETLVTYYAVYSIPGFPEMAPKDNVLPVMCHVEPRDEAWCNEVKKWEGISKQLLFYTYMGWRIDRPKLDIADSIRWCLEHKGIGMHLEQDAHSPINLLPQYLAGRVLWDVDADERAILDEFYTRYFGNAAEPMRQFFEIFDQATAEGAPNYNDCLYEYPSSSPSDGEKSVPYEWVAECRKRLRTALQLTKDPPAGEQSKQQRPAEWRRINSISQYWVATELHVKAQEAMATWTHTKSDVDGKRVHQAVKQASEYIQSVSKDFNLDNRLYLLSEMVRTVEKG